MSKKDITEAAFDWETSRVHALELSEARAWRIAKISTVAAALAIAAVATLAPFYKIVPLTFQVDKLTGDAQLVEMTGSKSITPTEAMDKHWVGDYVQSRERFVWTLIQRDFDHVMNLSGDSVAREYRTLYEPPNSRDKKLGPGTDERIKVTSVTLVPNEPGKAVVRFEKTTRRDGSDINTGRFIATIAYNYDGPSPLSREKSLVDNPLGFKVSGYVVDPDLSNATAVQPSPASSDPQPASAGGTGAELGSRPSVSPVGSGAPRG